MSAIEGELKELVAEQQKAGTSVSVAASAVEKSQGELDKAKAREAAVAQRLAPLQQLAGALASSDAALKKVRESAMREIGEAEKLHTNMFPAISKEVSTQARKELDDADAARQKSEGAREELEEEMAKAGMAQNLARAEANAAEARVRELVAGIGSLAQKIEAGRGRVAERLAKARNAVAAGKPGETFLALRDLGAERAALATIATEGADEELLKEIDTAHARVKEANERAARQATIFDALKEKLASTKKDLEGNRQAVDDARARVVANPPASTLQKT